MYLTPFPYLMKPRIGVCAGGDESRFWRKSKVVYSFHKPFSFIPFPRIRVVDNYPEGKLEDGSNYLDNLGQGHPFLLWKQPDNCDMPPKERGCWPGANSEKVHLPTARGWGPTFSTEHSIVSGPKPPFYSCTPQIPRLPHLELTWFFPFCLHLSSSPLSSTGISSQLLFTSTSRPQPPRLALDTTPLFPELCLECSRVSWFLKVFFKHLNTSKLCLPRLAAMMCLFYFLLPAQMYMTQRVHKWSYKHAYRPLQPCPWVCMWKLSPAIFPKLLWYLRHFSWSHWDVVIRMTGFGAVQNRSKWFPT